MLYYEFLLLQRMYLVMEFCEGGELADILKEKKYFMESEVKIITKELASAIAYLHKNGEYYCCTMCHINTVFIWLQGMFFSLQE